MLRYDPVTHLVSFTAAPPAPPPARTRALLAAFAAAGLAARVLELAAGSARRR
jgi:hypothetical protein